MCASVCYVIISKGYSNMHIYMYILFYLEFILYINIHIFHTHIYIKLNRISGEKSLVFF